jgi:hypothetical protein
MGVVNYSGSQGMGVVNYSGGQGANLMGVVNYSGRHSPRQKNLVELVN